MTNRQNLKKTKRKKQSPVSGQRSASKSILWHVFCLFYQQEKTWHMYMRGTKFLIYKVWWLREASRIGQTFHTPVCNWTSFHSKKRRKKDQKPENGCNETIQFLLIITLKQHEGIFRRQKKRLVAKCLWAIQWDCGAVQNRIGICYM